MNLVFEYIKYRWIAKQRHGVHSPFIFDLTDKCFREKVDIRSLNTIKRLTDSLIKNNSSIEIQDFGAGSKKLSNKRKISTILKVSSSKGKYGRMLYQLSKHFEPKKTLEFGTSLGIGAIYLKKGYSKGEVTTVEACPNTHQLALQNFKEVDIEMNAINATFDDFLSTLTNQLYELVFVDGHHDGKALLRYMEALEKHTSNDTIFVIDDIRWSESMFTAWNELKDNQNYHVSIDLFRMGILSKRNQQEKEHFTIRL